MRLEDTSQSTSKRHIPRREIRSLVKQDPEERNREREKENEESKFISSRSVSSVIKVK